MSLLFAELAATCNALGYYDGNKYYTDIHCVETIKDLIRFLRRDDENHEIRRHLGEAGVLQSDLVPMLNNYWEQKDLFDVVLRLLVNLTNPALLLYREELPADKTTRNFYLQIIGHLQDYKESLCEQGLWAILANKLGTMLHVEWQERAEEDGLIIERILILARNILQVPADREAEKRLDNDASIHDQLLWALHQSGMVDIFLYIASSDNEQQYYMHVLEIVSLMLREQNPVQLAEVAITRSGAEKERDETELTMLRNREEQECSAKLLKYGSARHSRFGGTFVLKDVKSISDQDLIFHKPLNKVETLDFDHTKSKRKRPKNRIPMSEDAADRRSAFSIRLFLKEFCIEFLNGAYNTLMYHVKDNVEHAKAQANDESYYLWAMKFFMEFNRHYKAQVKLVSETMTIQSFHFVQTQLEKCFEMMLTDKKKIQLWSRRMHLALKAYQELLHTLATMDRSSDPGVRSSARVIKSNVFYVLEYRELILTLLQSYDEVKLSRLYLKDLVETAHIFLKLLELYCNRGRTVVVQKPRAARRRKANKSRPAPEPLDREALWDELGPELSAVLQSQMEIPGDVIPFDAASERNIDEQKVDAMIKIQVHLREHKFEEAVGMLRASREVWPENDCFGGLNMAPEEEFLALREVFITHIPGTEFSSTSQPDPDDAPLDEEDEDNEEDEQAANVANVSEQSFKFSEFSGRLVPDLLQFKT